jgi:hypothetical protein
MVDISRGLKTNSTGGHHLACLIPVVSGPGLASATGDQRVELSKQSQAVLQTWHLAVFSTTAWKE